MSFAIKFEQVSKKFILPHEFRPAGTASWGQRLRPHKEWKQSFWGLQDVSFAIAPGQAVGLIGPNGSGKSTILKLAVKILEPTKGQVSTRGRVVALLELGAGFHPDLSGYDNIFLNGSVLGISRKEIHRLIPEIVTFSELGQFIDSPVRYYSSGMFMRLAFAIAVHVRPDVLLIDESLSVGDQAFQTKCLTRIHEAARQGTTIILVSHDLEAVRTLCSRAIWLSEGRVQGDGHVDEIIGAYLRTVLHKEREMSAQAMPGSPDRWGSREIEITGVQFFGNDGIERSEFVTGQPFIARIHYRAHQAIHAPVFGCAIYRADGVHVNGPNTDFSGQPIAKISEGVGSVDYHVPMLPLLAGNYGFSAVVYDAMRIHAYDHQHLHYQFSVLPGGVDERYGLIYMPSRWEYRNGQ